MEATINMNATAENYEISLNAYTRGWLGKLVPWSGTFHSHGWIGDAQTPFIPKLHKSTATWKKETDITEYTYGKNGFEGLFITDHGKERRKEEVDKELTQNTTDVLSATMQALALVTVGDDCSSSNDIFDGKRRFRMVFDKEKDDVLHPTQYGVYTGPAQKCSVEIIPDGGAWHKKPRGWLSIQEQGKQKNALPAIWFAKLDEDSAAVPVRIEIHTDYGAMLMHLSEIQDNDKTILIAEKRE